MGEVMRVHHVITRIDGKVVEGESRMPPPLADRFAFERQFRKPYDSIFSHFRPVTKDGQPVLDDQGRPSMEMDPDNPVLMAEDMFFIYRALHRAGKVAEKYEAWCEQLDEIESTRIDDVDQAEDTADGEEPIGEEVGAADPPARELSPLPG